MASRPPPLRAASVASHWRPSATFALHLHRCQSPGHRRVSALAEPRLGSPPPSFAPQVAVARISSRRLHLKTLRLLCKSPPLAAPSGPRPVSRLCWRATTGSPPASKPPRRGASALPCINSRPSPVQPWLPPRPCLGCLRGPAVQPSRLAAFAAGLSRLGRLEPPSPRPRSWPTRLCCAESPTP